MAVLRPSNANLMKAGLDEILWEKEKVDPLDRVISDVFYMETHGSQYKRYMTIEGYPVMNEKTEGGSYTSADPGESYYTDLTHKGYGVYSTISHEAEGDERYGVIKQFPRSMRDAAAATINYHASRVLSSGFDSLPGYQTSTRTSSQYLFHTGHTMANGATQANKPSTDIALTATSLWAGVNTFYAMKNEAGLPLALTPKKLVVPHQLQQKARELLESQLYPENAENAKNVLRTAFDLSPVIWPYWLGSVNSDAWYILGDKAAMAEEYPLHFVWREKPWTKMTVEDLTDNLLYFIYMRFSCGWPNYRGIYGSDGPT